MRRPKPHYPTYWACISRWVRYVRAQGRCECTGQCGLHRTHPGPRRCVEVNHTPGVWMQGRVVLTVAHLCTCEPPCGLVEHLGAFCQRCHLRTDQELHLKHVAETRRLAKEQAGQLALLETGHATD